MPSFAANRLAGRADAHLESAVDGSPRARHVVPCVFVDRQPGCERERAPVNDRHAVDDKHVDGNIQHGRRVEPEKAVVLGQRHAGWLPWFPCRVQRRVDVVHIDVFCFGIRNCRVFARSQRSLNGNSHVSLRDVDFVDKHRKRVLDEGNHR